MTCRQVRVELVECWACTEELSAAVLEHIEVCVECRREAILLRETRVMLSALPLERAPEGFTGRVMTQLDREEAEPGWLERLSEALFPARRPSWARAAAVGTAIALAVAGGVVWYNHGGSDAAEQFAANPPVTAIVAGADGGATVSDAELEELLLRHQALEMTQPLADDAGVNLVVYTSN
ncbi:MAG: anti-sigma factor family protein [Armatimonadota bacterium]|jgi:anti-sigma factor RsiW